MDKKLISVIVAVYNVRKYLNKCIDSIINQTYQNLEIILVDDGSTDGSSELCDNWAEKDQRIYAIHKKNGGLSDARNIGIDRAHGKWIGFIDGDDYIAPSMFQNLYNDRVDQGIVVCGFYIVKRNLIKECCPITAEMKPREAVQLYISNEITAFRASQLTFFGSYAWNKLYDISLFKNIRYPKGKKFEDMYIIFALIHASSKIKFIPHCEYYYIQRDSSITHSFKTLQTDCLEARRLQQKQISEFWGMNPDVCMKLIAFELFSIIIHFALLDKKNKPKYKETRNKAFRDLKLIGLNGFTFIMKLKLFLCLYAPSLFIKMRSFVKRKE